MGHRHRRERERKIGPLTGPKKIAEKKLVLIAYGPVHSYERKIKTKNIRYKPLRRWDSCLSLRAVKRSTDVNVRWSFGCEGRGQDPVMCLLTTTVRTSGVLKKPDGSQTGVTREYS